VRLVLDTNTLVSALVFRQGRLDWLRRAWQAGQITPLVSGATLEELLRVLAYPKFRLDREEIDELLAEFLPFAETVPGPVPVPAPTCRDPDDQVFIELALVAKADGLVTGDRALLALAGETSLLVQTPAAWRDALCVPGASRNGC
jgi:putative PIN family toxin of toxin-antitoxin system